MHQLAGLSWSEWASIIAIVTFLATIIGLLFKYVVFAPIQVDIKELNQNFRVLNKTLDILQSNVDKMDRRIDAHDRRLDRHHEQIKNLYKDKE